MIQSYCKSFSSLEFFQFIRITVEYCILHSDLGYIAHFNVFTTVSVLNAVLLLIITHFCEVLKCPFPAIKVNTPVPFFCVFLILFQV